MEMAFPLAKYGSKETAVQGADSGIRSLLSIAEQRVTSPP